MQAEAAEFESKIAAGVSIYRSSHYNHALRLLRQIVLDSENGICEAIRAGLVSDWLAKYPWQGHSGDGVDVKEASLRAAHQLFVSLTAYRSSRRGCSGLIPT